MFELLRTMFKGASPAVRAQVVSTWMRFSLAYAQSGLDYSTSAANADLLTLEYFKRYELIMQADPDATSAADPKVDTPPSADEK